MFQLAKSLCLIILSLLVAPISYAEEPAAPSQRVEQFLNLILYEGYKNRIGANEKEQQEWLASAVRSLVKIAECDVNKAFQEESRPLDWVDATIFFDRWDTPSYCQSISSEKTNNGYKVRVECTWGDGKDHPVGSKLEMFTEVVLEESKWKIANIVHGKEEDNEVTTTNDLLDRLRNAGNQSEHPEICKSI